MKPRKEPIRAQLAISVSFPLLPNSFTTDTKKICLLQWYKDGITFISHHFGSYAMLWLYNTSAQKPCASPSPTKYDFEVMLFNNWQCYDNFNIQPVNCIVDGQVSHGTPTNCSRHSFRIYSKTWGSQTYPIQNRLSNLYMNQTSEEVAREENLSPINSIWSDEVGAHWTLEQNGFIDYVLHCN